MKVTALAPARYWEFAIDAERAWLDGSGCRDPEWTYTDKAGHEHSGGDDSTLVAIEETCYCDIDGGHPHDLFDHWECRECGETITPGVLPPGSRILVPELVDYYARGLRDEQPVQVHLVGEEGEAVAQRMALTRDAEILQRIIAQVLEQYADRLESPRSLTFDSSGITGWEW